MRNVLARVPKGNAEMVAAAIRTIFAQPDAEHVHSQLDVIAAMLGRQFPQVEAMLPGAENDLLAFTAFPVGHWKKIWSTNPLESSASSRTPPPCSGWPARSWSKRTTNGRSPTAATSPKAPWLCSTDRPNRSEEEVAQPALIAS
jgi:putative transposase